MSEKRTPGPWESTGMHIFSKSANYAVCSIRAHNSGEGKANAAFIVRACNSHDALVEALGAALRLDYFREHTALAEQARAAFALAKGEAHA